MRGRPRCRARWQPGSDASTGPARRPARPLPQGRSSAPACAAATESQPACACSRRSPPARSRPGDRAPAWVGSQPVLVFRDPVAGSSAVVGARVAMATAVAATLALAPAAQAAFPGRDGLIAFTRAEGSKHGQLYLVRPDGSGLRRITHRRHGAGGASWSPDGRRILFSSTPRRGGVQVFVKRLGGGVRQLTRGRDTYAYPAWSPSGRRIAAVRGPGARDGFQYESLVTMRADGSRKRVVYSGGRLSTSYPAWSPDGRSIAFVHTDIGGTGADPNVYVVPAAGGPATLVTDVGSQDHPDWSPDGRLIAYTYGLELGPDDIRVVRPDRSGDAPVTDALSVSDGWPAWAPSGRRLAISRLGRIWTLAPDGSGLRQLTRGRTGVNDWDPSWQPR